jgi:hypothetical protein
MQRQILQEPLGSHANFVINFCQILFDAETARIAAKGAAMRVSDDRYTRDRQRLDLALRLIRHEARTFTIRQWTGLSDDRIRKLYRSYCQHGAARRDAPSRQVAAPGGVLLQESGSDTVSGRFHAAQLASLFRWWSVRPPTTSRPV